ncbi:MAG: proprotein convertase P-domain-containing protein [Myxococcota bacterium]|nr:proprotein convertase P-domain-containing protein [Myxococcota bacterium]
MIQHSLFSISLLLFSCTGPQGEPGPPGEDGATGEQGEPGANGQNANCAEHPPLLLSLTPPAETLYKDFWSEDIPYSLSDPTAAVRILGAGAEVEWDTESFRVRPHIAQPLQLVVMAENQCYVASEQLNLHIEEGESTIHVVQLSDNDGGLTIQHEEDTWSLPNRPGTQTLTIPAGEQTLSLYKDGSSIGSLPMLTVPQSVEIVTVSGESYILEQVDNNIDATEQMRFYNRTDAENVTVYGSGSAAIWSDDHPQPITTMPPVLGVVIGTQDLDFNMPVDEAFLHTFIVERPSGLYNLFHFQPALPHAALETPVPNATVEEQSLVQETLQNPSYSSTTGYMYYPVQDPISVSNCAFITDIEVEVQIGHEQNEDLIIQLIKPNLESIVLKDLGESLGSGTALVGSFPSDWTPSESFESLLSDVGNGTWALDIYDTSPYHPAGNFEAWGLSFHCYNP